MDAWFDQSGYICVSTGPRFDDVGRAAVEAAAELGAPERIYALDAAQVRSACAAPTFRRGVCVPDFATLQPARLALGLRRRLIERGVAMFERSHVRALRSPPRTEAEAEWWPTPPAVACGPARPCSRWGRRRARCPSCARA